MKFTTLSRRTAAAGAASALVAGALVGATTTAAQAAPVTNTYNCNNPAVGTFPVVLNSDAPGIEGIPGASAGFAVPAGLLTVTNQFTIPEQVYNTLSGFGIENLTFPDFAGTLGSSSIPVAGMAVTVSGMTNNGNGTYSSDPAEGSGQNETFETPAAGDYPVLSPEAFTINADLNGSPVPVACTLASGAPGAYDDSIVIAKNESATKVTSNSPVKKGDVAKIKAKVSAANETPTGKVIFKKGTKKLGAVALNAKGIAILKTKALAVGKNKITTTYKGDGYTTGSKGSTTVKVTR